MSGCATIVRLSTNLDAVVAERNADGSGHATAERSGRPEFGEQQVILDMKAQGLVLLPGRVHDTEVDDAALVVELQIHHSVTVSESHRSRKFQHGLGDQHGGNV